MPLAVMKGLIVRHFDYWLAQDIFDRDGILNIGYAYPNLIMVERYNTPGSPYWSMKAFLLLALPDSHPFWSANAAPIPILDEVKPLPEAAMLMHRRDGDVTAYAAGVCELYGHGHVVEKYAKFAYSTSFGMSVARSNFVLHEACPDSMLAFVQDGEDTVYVRKRSERTANGNFTTPKRRHKRPQTFICRTQTLLHGTRFKYLDIFSYKEMAKVDDAQVTLCI